MEQEIQQYIKDGYQYELLDFQGREGVIVFPRQAAPDRPWIWRTEFLGCFDWVDRALLKKGWHVVYIRMSDWYGAPRIINFMEIFYGYIRGRYALKQGADLFGFSRGGLYALNFAAKNPGKVRTLYLDAPVIDLASWPGGFYHTAPHLEKEWREACGAYEMSEEQLKDYKKGVTEKFKAIYEAAIPVILVAGLADTDVPYEENGALLEAYMKERNACRFKVIKKEKCGHHPHSLEEPERIVEYIVNNEDVPPGRH